LANTTIFKKKISDLESISVRLCGDVPYKARIDAIDRFQQDESVRICFLSLNASSEGITLTAATRMYIMDQWWNPARDYQAMHRLYRIGQTKPVQIFAIYVDNSIENRLRTIRAAKGAMAMATIAEAAPPEDLDWCQQARFFFDLSDDDDDDCERGNRRRSKRKRDVPLCKMPGLVINSSGFGSSYNQNLAHMTNQASTTPVIVPSSCRPRIKRRMTAIGPRRDNKKQDRRVCWGNDTDDDHESKHELEENHPLFGALFF